MTGGCWVDITWQTRPAIMLWCLSTIQ